MSLDVTTAAAILKRTYPDGIVELDYKESPTLALIKKKKGALVKGPFGASFDQPVKHGNPQAASATYATGYAQAPNENTRYKLWSITPATQFGFARVNGDLVRRSEGVGSFIEALTSEIENAKTTIRRNLEIQLFKEGYGMRAQFSSTATVASATGVALAQKWMVRHIEIGQSIVFSASVSGNVLRSATPIKVVGRNVSAGTLDFAAAPNTQSGAVSDYLFLDGERQNSATPSKLLLTGFKGWVPQTAPVAAENFFGIDRSVDNRLGGFRLDATNSGSVEEACLDLMALVGSEGGRTTHLVMGPDTYNRLVKSLTNKVFIDIETDQPGVGFPGVRVTGGSGTASAYADGACEEGVIYALNMDEIELRYAGKDLVYLEESDGLMFRRVAGADDWLSELVNCCNLIVPTPGHQGLAFNV